MKYKQYSASAVLYLGLSAVLLISTGLNPVVAEQSGSSFDDVPQFGGPSSVGAELRDDATDKKPAFRFESIDNFLQPYFDFKTRTNKDHGFAFGFDYTTMYQGASESPGEMA